jgi:hypothetical protein
MIFAACNTDDGIDTATFQALGSTMTMDDMLDVLEMKAVRDSWSHAEMFNMDIKREQDAKVRGVQGKRPTPKRPKRGDR